MGLEEKVFNEVLDQEGYTKKIKYIMSELYTRGYHDGRRNCRKKFVDSNYLIVDPNKVNQLLEDCQDPCRYCENFEPSYKRGCTLTETCDKKQKQLDAIEIEKYFLNGN